MVFRHRRSGLFGPCPIENLLSQIAFVNPFANRFRRQRNMGRPKKEWGVRYKKAAELYKDALEYFPPGKKIQIHECMLAKGFTKAESDDESI